VNLADLAEQIARDVVGLTGPDAHARAVAIIVAHLETLTRRREARVDERRLMAITRNRETGGSIPACLEQEAQKFGHALEVLGLDPPVLNKSGGSDVCPSCRGPFRRLAAIDTCRDPWHNG
jgi:hypothetical protein